MTSPPSVIAHTTMYTYEGSASIADAGGGLLFYTDGSTVWNKELQVMANGTGLLGNGSTVQSALIVKQPGNTNIYYVFTLDLQGNSNGLRYSLVDMDLAVGMGSVTVKNVPITTPCTEQLNATRHCNGIDMWIVAHDFATNNFKSFLLTSAGLNFIPVVSGIGPVPPAYINNVVYGQGTIKLSPTGKKLGLTFANGTSNSQVALFDFDRSTGQVSNYLALITGTVNYWGCEFSGDGTKFYTRGIGVGVLQWDICAGSNALIIASQTTVGSSGFGQLQLAPNGKIYLVSGTGSQLLSAINSPNLQGLACNFTPSAQSIATGTNGFCLPNFYGGAFKILPSFSYTFNPLLSCGTASFAAPPNPTLAAGCGASGSLVQSIQWNFSQPQSGPANTSTLIAPTHNFGGPGVYPVKLILNYQCGADTIYQNVIIPGPTITVSSSSISCTSTGGASVSLAGTSGALSYTWLPSAQTTSAATVNPGTYTVLINDAGGNCNYTHSTFINPTQPLTGTVNVFSICNGATNGGASISLIMGTGGTGNYIYNWSGGQTTSSVSGLPAGLYSVTVTDAGCSFTSTFQITQAPSVNLTVIAPTVQVCSATLQALAAGGTPPFTYSWFGGPHAPVFVATQTMSGMQIYSVMVTDDNGCSTTGSTQVSFLGSPSLAVQSVSICLNTKATLTVSGASSYSWMPGGNTGVAFTVSPTSTQIYTVSGSYTNGCISKTTVTVSVFGCTAIENEGQGNTIFRVYPNPISNELFVETAEAVEVYIHDLAGRELFYKKLEIGNSTLDFSELKFGIYIMSTYGTGKYPVKKIVKLE